MPGTYLGAHLSSSLPSGLIRRALAFVLLASSLKTFGVGNGLTLALLGVSLLIAPPLWMPTRRRHGFPALARNALPTPRQRNVVRRREAVGANAGRRRAGEQKPPE